MMQHESSHNRKAFGMISFACLLAFLWLQKEEHFKVLLNDEF
jgi:hypothetical protein